MTGYLFVYGTLKRGKHNNYLLDEAKFIGNDSIKGDMRGYGIPMLFKGSKNVPGEVYEVTGQILFPISAMERKAGYEEKIVTTNNGRAVIAYFINENEDRSFYPEIDTF